MRVCGAGALAALAAAAALATCAPRAFAEDRDPWLGRDKALHFSASAGLGAAGYAGSVPFTESRAVRAACGTGLALSAGIAKELYDLHGAGDASWRDMTANVLGTATGVALAWATDRLITHLFYKPAHARAARRPELQRRPRWN